MKANNRRECSVYSDAELVRRGATFHPVLAERVFLKECSTMRRPEACPGDEDASGSSLSAPASPGLNIDLETLRFDKRLETEPQSPGWTPGTLALVLLPLRAMTRPSYKC
jgi:hypothetical protein